MSFLRTIITKFRQHSVAVKAEGVRISYCGREDIELRFDRDWDSSGYYDNEEPNRITIPQQLGGHYLVCVQIRWIIPKHILHDLEVDPAAEGEACFSANLCRNDETIGNQARATANRVTGSKGTYQNMTFETMFAPGDVITLKINHSFREQYIEIIEAFAYLQIRRIGKVIK